MIIFFFFNDTATTEIYTLSLPDALPILQQRGRDRGAGRRRLSRHPQAMARDAARHLRRPEDAAQQRGPWLAEDRKSKSLNSSHLVISYAVLCLKKNKP